jgi:sugar phosphate isomerase/epimerase
MLVAMRSRHDNPTLDQWSEQIECAKLLGAQIVTNPQSIGIPDEPELNGCGFAAEVVKRAEEKGVTLCLETCFDPAKDGITQQAARLDALREVGRRFESIRYCLDAGYTYVDGHDPAVLQKGFRQYVDDFSPRVVHLHLSDNYGPVQNCPPSSAKLTGGSSTAKVRIVSESSHFGFPGGSSAYQGLCRFWCGGGMPLEDWDYLLKALNQCDNEIIGSIAMSPCMPSVMIRQASEFLFDILKWPNRPKKPSLGTSCSILDTSESPKSGI